MTEQVSFYYTNYKGERARRTILAEPISVEYTSNEWHPEKQFLMTAWDVDKGAFRTFAIKDMED